ncbi:hypothetical protein SAMN05446635_6190 [Burkholderia sp. OK233]|nr:hypothetical protein SAMN05446635_6190 [Burkholderia sp. OK233]
MTLPKRGTLLTVLRAAAFNSVTLPRRNAGQRREKESDFIRSLT